METAEAPWPELPKAVRRATYVVVPAFHEEAVIREVVEMLAREGYPHVVVVDDGSSDATARQAAAGGATVLRHAVNRGQGAALQTGMTYSLHRGAGYVVTFDADGQHDPADIASLLRPLAGGEVEVTLGSRFLGTTVDMPPSRRLMLKLAVLFTRITSGLRVTDTHNGLRAFTRLAASRIRLDFDRMAHASEIFDQIRRRQLPFREVPVRIRYTPYSRAKGQGVTAAFRIVLDYLLGRLAR